MFASAHFIILLFALVVDRLIGDPDWVWKRIPHPVDWLGRLIEAFDRAFNNEDQTDSMRRTYGLLTILVLLLFCAVVGYWLKRILGFAGPFGLAAEIFVVAILISQKSLADHVRAVATGLRKEGLAGGREAVSRIVARDPKRLDESGVARAAIESLAKNASDGVVAPAFWYAAFGLPGLLAYKMLNAADSMIGHRNRKYRDFGWASARLEDIANWIPARLTGFLIVGADFTLRSVDRARRTLRVMFRDARLHRSPNAGWPESAMAAALGIALSGPRVYAGEMSDDPYINVSGRHLAGDNDIVKAIAIYWRAMTLLIALVVLFFVVLRLS